MVNSACPIKKDDNTGVPIRRAMFCHLYKTIIVQFNKFVCNVPTVAMAIVQCCKKTLIPSFSEQEHFASFCGAEHSRR